jgi:hypothetical protein
LCGIGAAAIHTTRSTRLHTAVQSRPPTNRLQLVAHLYLYLSRPRAQYPVAHLRAPAAHAPAAHAPAAYAPAAPPRKFPTQRLNLNFNLQIQQLESRMRAPSACTYKSASDVANSRTFCIRIHILQSKSRPRAFQFTCRTVFLYSGLFPTSVPSISCLHRSVIRAMWRAAV